MWFWYSLFSLQSPSSLLEFFQFNMLVSIAHSSLMQFSILLINRSNKILILWESVISRSSIRLNIWRHWLFLLFQHLIQLNFRCIQLCKVIKFMILWYLCQGISEFDSIMFLLVVIFRPFKSIIIQRFWSFFLHFAKSLFLLNICVFDIASGDEFMHYLGAVLPEKWSCKWVSVRDWWVRLSVILAILLEPLLDKAHGYIYKIKRIFELITLWCKN